MQEQALAAEDPKSAADLGLAFHRIARTVRQSIALEAKLVRDAERAERELQRDAEARHELLRETPPQEEPREVAQRKAAVREVVCKVIWDEVEDALERDYLSDLLEERLRLGARDAGFCDEDLGAQVDRLLADFGLVGHILAGDGELGPVEFDAAPPPPTDPPAAPSSA